MSDSRKNMHSGKFVPARQSHGELDNCLLAYSIKPDLCIKAHNWQLYIYSSRKEAEHQLAIIKQLIGDKHVDLIANACVIQTRQYPDTPYRFRLSSEQHRTLESIRYSDRLVKSLRWDKDCFFDKFTHDITHVAPKEVAPRHPLRRGKHKKYTVYASGVHSRDQKPSPYPAKRVHEKQFLSPPQSTTLITREAQAPVFGHNTDRKEALVGIITNPGEALINRFFIYDRGTVNRPYEFDSILEANTYQRQIAGNLLFDHYQKFKTAITQNTRKHNEVLARIAWNKRSSAIGLFTDTFESRCIAQVYKKQLTQKLKQRAREVHQPWDERYDIPLVYYIPGNKQNLTTYTLKAQQADQLKADEILNDRKQREQAFNNNQFAFLLLVSEKNINKACNLSWNNKSILSVLVEKKLFHIVNYLYPSARELVDRAEAAKCIDTLMFHACEKGDEQLAKKLIVDGVDVNADRTTDGATALYIAAKKGHHDIVETLLAKGADVNAVCTTIGATALHIAARNGHHKVVKTLLTKGADVNIARTDDGATALHIAVQNGHHDIVKTLLAKGADANAASTTIDATALHIAAQNGHHDIVETLLAKGADVNAVCTTIGATALHIAARNGHHDIVKTLLTKGADANAACTNDGATALMTAVEHGHHNIVKTLLENKADINTACTTNGITALHIAAYNGHHNIVKTLLENKADVNIARTDDGATALHIAVQNGHLDIVKTLLAKGADVNAACTTIGATALHIAARDGHLDIVKTLLAKGADVNAAKTDGATALIIAAENGYDKIVKMLKFAINKQKLLDYSQQITNRINQHGTNHHEKSLKLFGHAFNFGYSAKEKQAAADALNKVVLKQADQMILDVHKGALSNGKLGEIYCKFRL